MTPTHAEPAAIDVLARVAPAIAVDDVAEPLHRRLRVLAAHWAATPYRGDIGARRPE